MSTEVLVNSQFMDLFADPSEKVNYFDLAIRNKQLPDKHMNEKCWGMLNEYFKYLKILH